MLLDARGVAVMQCGGKMEKGEGGASVSGETS